MPIVYPMQQIGRFGLGFGFNYKFLHDRYGFDLGERYHRDVDYRVRTTLEIDRAVYSDFGAIGAGFADPFPRISIEPFGHRFMPAMYGCEIRYAPDQEPWCLARVMPGEEIEKLESWTPARLERSEPVRIILSQFEEIKKKYDSHRIPDKIFNPHYRTMSTLQNLGSVINSAFSIQSDELFINYATEPNRVHQFYRNIAELTLCCLAFFPQRDGWPLRDVFIGNCVVSMISPAQYARFNLPYDRMILDYARAIAANFVMHQDSNVTAHLENYARLGPIQALDVGQDTDFEKVLALFPDASVNCILLPSWLMDKTADAIQQDLTRLIAVGKRFPLFSFTLLEIDQNLGENRAIFELFEIFRKCTSSA